MKKNIEKKWRMSKERDRSRKMSREKTSANNESESKFRSAKQVDLREDSESMM